MSLHPLFATIMASHGMPQQQPEPAEAVANKARQSYLDWCALHQRIPDPVMADETYQRAFAKANGRHYYAGD